MSKNPGVGEIVLKLQIIRCETYLHKYIVLIHSGSAGYYALMLCADAVVAFGNSL